MGASAQPYPVKEAKGDAYDEAVVELLIQEHAYSQTTLLVLDVLGRLMSAGLVIYLGVTPELTVTRLVSALAVALLLAGFWMRGRSRALRRVFSVEETLSRMTSGSAERAYIESRFIAESGRRPIDFVLRLEPAIWLYAVLATALISILMDGLAS